jgi:hypothetical protein
MSTLTEVMPVQTRIRRGAPPSASVSLVMRKRDVARLEKAAEAAGLCRSEAIRRGIETFIAEQEIDQAPTPGDQP